MALSDWKRPFIDDQYLFCDYSPAEYVVSVWRKADQMKLHVEYEQEEDGRWIAEIPELPGVMCYGTSRNDAAAKVEALALRAIADRLDEGEMAASPITIETMERVQA